MARDEQLRFTDLRRRVPSRPAGKDVRYDDAERTWIAEIIRVYVGPRKAART